jgi:chromate transporter
MVELPNSSEQSSSSPPPRRSLTEIAGYFLRLGALGFGGPAALCALMERQLVEEKGWLTREEMRDAIAVSQTLPGPLAIQVGIFVSYLRGGFWGAWVGGAAFILPNFVIVSALAALYVRFGGLSWMTAVFYGVSPAIIALILHSCWRLAKLGVRDRLQGAIAAVCFAVTVALKAEVALLFILAGLIGIGWYGTLLKRLKPTAVAGTAVVPVALGAGAGVKMPILARLFLFFLKAGSLTFGSGLVIVPFLEKGVVQQNGWLNGREFLVAVAVGMLSPGPVVITATFVGYLTAGLPGAAVSTIGIFLPSFLLILIAAPLLARHRANANVQGFIKGAYAAAIGTILGACVLLGRIAIGDWLTILIGIVSLIVLFRTKAPQPLIVAAAAVIGLIAFPMLRPTWVFVK